MHLRLRYCVSRKSNDIKRAAFTVDEVVDLTINLITEETTLKVYFEFWDFQRCRFYDGTFGKNCQNCDKNIIFYGYIHLKTIPGASDELMKEAGLYADRLSINLEIPTESGLKLLAPKNLTNK